MSGERTIGGATGSMLEDRLPTRVWLEVPFEEKDLVKRFGARWDAAERRWWVRSDEELEMFDPWLPSSLIDFGPATEHAATVNLLGLVYDCWRCRHRGVALVGMIDRGRSLSSSYLVLCDNEDSLRLADRTLPDDVRRTRQMGTVKRRYSRTVQAAYLSQGCGLCDGLWGDWPLFHEAVPEALAEMGGGALLELATVTVPDSWWLRATDRY